MVGFRFDLEKNAWLKETRDVSFEEVVEAIASGVTYRVIDHPNTSHYPHQKMIEIEINGYFYSIPAIEEAPGKFFLKTLYPNRKLTRREKRIKGENR